MVFVFGSNLAGRHGKGAALFAKMNMGAISGQGEGLQGQSYAIPTKGYNLEVLDLSVVEAGLHRFLKFANENRGMTFELTPIGTGLAGYRKGQIWAMLKRGYVPSNVLLTSSWITA